MEPPAPGKPTVAEFIAVSQNTFSTVARARDLARTSCPVLITGPAGAGKRTLALAQHAWSGRKPGAGTLFCRDLRPEVLSLHLRTAATLILHQLSDLSPDAQNELLDLAIKPQPPVCKVRLIATSALSLFEIAEKQLLPDTLTAYFATVQLTLDPLSLRPHDVLALAQHFLAAACVRYNKRVDIHADALRLLPQLYFPDNVATLRELIEQTVIEAAPGSAISVGNVETVLCRHAPPTSLASPWSGLSLEEELALHERRLIRQALEQEKGSITRAARLLGITHQTLGNRIRSRHEDLAHLRKHLHTTNDEQ